MREILLERAKIFRELRDYVIQKKFIPCKYCFFLLGVEGFENNYFNEQ